MNQYAGLDLAEQLAAKIAFDKSLILAFNFNQYLGVPPSLYQDRFWRLTHKYIPIASYGNLTCQ